ncbi:NAD(P)H-binding protein [uncultured Croceitalea sp.]|uniref:NAD(P)-dependent oxidoreductase n=1 Tax=uncultured Croceitalea sp. TaxID=1798908 RepID=UPI003305A8B9
MKITIIGAGGNIGQRIVKEAAARNYELQLISSKNKDFFGLDNISTHKVNIFETEALTRLFEGSDVVISAYAPPHKNTDLIIDASKSLIKAAKKANTRLITVGGAGSLKISKDMFLVDAPNFPEEYKTLATSHKRALEEVFLNETEVNWTNVSPSAFIFEGERTNQFRIGENQLLANEKGDSSISMEDFAVGILNEVENASFSKKRFTIGY